MLVVNTPPASLSLAVLLTVCNYAVLTGYDFLAFAYIGKKLSSTRIVLASFLAYAIANNVGFAMVSGASVRYRFYTRWGVTAEELSRIVFSYAVTFWLGLLLLGGLSLGVSQLPSAFAFPGSEFARPVGWILVLASLAYVAATFIRRKPLRFGRVDVPLPSPRIAVAQLAVSALDWTLAAAVLYVLLPPSDLSFLTLLGAFVTAQLLGLASHVPGGVGVFEGLMVLLLKPFLASTIVLPALLVYRAVYYLLPLVGGARRARRRRTASAAGTGRADERTARPHDRAARAAPPGALHVPERCRSSFFRRHARCGRTAGHPRASLAARHHRGVSLPGERRGGRAPGAVAWPGPTPGRRVRRRRSSPSPWASSRRCSKPVNYEEALALMLMLLVLWRARPAFDRRAAFFDTRFSAGWILAIVGALGASIWIGLFAFKHVEYSNELWWQFELHGEASRFLRGSVGAAVSLLLFALARLMAPAPHEVVEPTDADLDDARRIIDEQTSTFPYLVFLRDKAMLFDDERQGFVMYGVQGRTWVALGDPVGPPERTSDLDPRVPGEVRRLRWRPGLL